jgi:hypothetical protein
MWLNNDIEATGAHETAKNISSALRFPDRREHAVRVEREKAGEKRKKTY